MDNPYGFIYLVRSLAGKLYVGQTTRSVKIRWQSHLHNAKSGTDTYIANAIRKYGKEAFSVETLATCADQETLNRLEHYFINKVFQSTNPLLGYNIRGGGDSIGTHSDETKLRMSGAQRVAQRQRAVGKKARWAKKLITQLKYDTSEYGKELWLEHREELIPYMYQ
jgi:group I intron endonuclease